MQITGWCGYFLATRNSKEDVMQRSHLVPLIGLLLYHGLHTGSPAHRLAPCLHLKRRQCPNRAIYRISLV